MKTNNEKKSISSKVLEVVGKPSLVKAAVLTTALMIGGLGGYQAYHKTNKSVESYQMIDKAYNSQKQFYGLNNSF